MYENVIVYTGDADKVAAQILHWQLKDSLIIERTTLSYRKVSSEKGLCCRWRS